MSDELRVRPFGETLDWILAEYAAHQSIFSIPESVFYKPRPDEPFSCSLFGHLLSTPIGPAAGPHTQMTQNIVSAWLTGGRFIELKTVQVMDELDIPRPCIDLADEGYNVEWSQELRLDDSVMEYIKAWVLVHVLRRILGHEGQLPFGTIFNMSVGYNLEGILSPPMQRFMRRLEDASEDLEPLREILKDSHPEFADLEIPSRIVDSVTLSTMHGCPPDEIERIAKYLIEERGLNTTVKLNPTLLGKVAVLDTLHQTLGFTEIRIPDPIFENDLRYDRALELIRALQATANAAGVTFSVKLSNTLAMANHRAVLPGDEMYMSGRALFPVTVQLLQKLRSDLGSDLRVSYSAGADAGNWVALLRTGVRPITVASDLLKPGGYGRFSQYLDVLRDAMSDSGASSLEALANQPEAALEQLVQDALASPRYKKSYHPFSLPKVRSALEPFDCIEAPCKAQCAVCQDIPEYAYWIGESDPDRALSAILHRNALPACTGYVCTHLCQTRCTRNNYDEPVAIRGLKRFAVEHGDVTLQLASQVGARVAIIGAGPSGLSAAFYLALSGVDVTVFESNTRPGGMPALAPGFRIPQHVVESDITRITDLGVHIQCNHRISDPPEALLASGYAAVYVACGFNDDTSLPIDGIASPGVMGALELLDLVAHGERPELGNHPVVIGGGNTAMDAARTSQRLTGHPATVAYRRTRAEMPAEEEEINELLAEGNRLEELCIPQRVLIQGDRVRGLLCLRAQLGEPDADGRRRPIPIEGSEFTIEASAIIQAIGQRADTSFLDQSAVTVRSSDGGIDVLERGQTGVPHVYAGGDIARGPAIIIAACEDGRRAAIDICEQLEIPFHAPDLPQPGPIDPASLKAQRTRQSDRQRPTMLEISKRDGFDPVESTLTSDQALVEAKRCLQCQILCDKCVDVCPNRANIPLHVVPVDCRVPRFELTDGTLRESGSDIVAIRQERQILHINELCNECGNCETFCVHDGRPFRDKPRLFLDTDQFQAEMDNAYHLEEDGIRCRTEGRTERMTALSDGCWRFETCGAQFTLSPDYAVLDRDLEAATATRLSLRSAVEMAILYKAIRSNAPYLAQSATTMEGRMI